MPTGKPSGMRALLALAASLLAPDAVASFYEASPSDLRGQPGDVIRYEALEDSPPDAAAYRVLYQSTGMHNEPIAVSGVVIIPLGPPPESGRNVVAWAHGTTGVDRSCAPSLWPKMWASL